MITYYDVTTYFESLLLSIDDIKTVVNADAVYNEFAVEDYETCLAYCIFEPETANDSHVVFNVRIEIVDLVDISNDNAGTPDNFKGNNNIIDVYNTTLAITRLIYTKIRHKTQGSNKFFIEQSQPLEKLYDASQNVAGFAITLSVQADDAITSSC